MFSWPVPRILIPLLLTLGLLPAAGFGGGYTLASPISYNYSPILNTGGGTVVSADATTYDASGQFGLASSGNVVYGLLRW